MKLKFTLAVVILMTYNCISELCSAQVNTSTNFLSTMTLRALLLLRLKTQARRAVLKGG